MATVIIIVYIEAFSRHINTDKFVYLNNYQASNYNRLVAKQIKEFQRAHIDISLTLELIYFFKRKEKFSNLFTNMCTGYIVYLGDLVIT